jgi:DNA-binding MarR family transcriptional regulator
MLQPTSVAEVTDSGLDARIAELHEALRLVIVNARRGSHAGELDRGAMVVLHMLKEREPARASDLALCTGLDASTISRHIKALIDDGYLAQSADPDDARARLLSLSQAGNDTLDRVRAHKIALHRAALMDWSTHDIDLLTTLLRRFGAALESEDS